MTIDYTDPAAVLNKLKAAKYQLLAGEKEQTVEVPDANGVSKRITYHNTDLKMLDAEITRLDAIVNPTSNGRPKRFAIRGG